MISYLADTNILGYCVRQNFPALNERVREALDNQLLAISAVTRAETRFGLALMDRNDKRRAAINQLLDEIPTLDWTSQAADLCGDLDAHLRRSGQPIGAMDVMIAAHAMSLNVTLITHNTRHFSRIPGLVLEDWVA